jgi:hypothetical protein
MYSIYIHHIYMCVHVDLYFISCTHCITYMYIVHTCKHIPGGQGFGQFQHISVAYLNNDYIAKIIAIVVRVKWLQGLFGRSPLLPSPLSPASLLLLPLQRCRLLQAVAVIISCSLIHSLTHSLTHFTSLHHLLVIADNLPLPLQ